jgi:hypothetical protein
MSIEHWVNDNGRKHIEVLKKERIYECHNATSNSIWTYPGWNPVSHGDRPATNSLSQPNLIR